MFFPYSKYQILLSVLIIWQAPKLRSSSPEAMGSLGWFSGRMRELLSVITSCCRNKAKKKKKGLPGASVMVVMVLHSWAFERKYRGKKGSFQENVPIRCWLKTVVYAQCSWALLRLLGGPRSTENGTKVWNWEIQVRLWVGAPFVTCSHSHSCSCSIQGGLNHSKISARKSIKSVWHTRNLGLTKKKNLRHAAGMNIELCSGFLIDTFKKDILKGQPVPITFSRFHGLLSGYCNE